MNVRTSRWLLVTVFILVVAVGCSPAAAPSLPNVTVRACQQTGDGLRCAGG